MTSITQRIAELSPQQLEKLAQRLKAKKKRKARPASKPGPAAITKREVETPPLSFAQRRLWFLDQLNPGSFNYNIPIAMGLRQLPSVEILERCFGELVRRHETLRTTFGRKNGEPIQIIGPAEAVAIRVVDLGGLESHGLEQTATALKSTEAALPFDLEKGPLFRNFLILAQKPCLVFNIHHIISDVWSMGVLLREIGAIYHAYCTAKPQSLSPLPIQYADFSLWQHRYFGSGGLEADLAFWRNHLADAPPLLELPTGKPRPPVQRYRGTRRHFLFSPILAHRLRDLVQHRNVTMFMIMMAAYSALLYRYTGRRDLLLGSTFSGRHPEETRGLIGFFVNTLPLRLRIPGNPCFEELLEQARDMVLGVIAHERAPFEKIVEDLKVPRNQSHTPVFQNVFAYNDFPAYETDHGGLIGEVTEIDNSGTPFDLVLFVTHTKQGLVGSLRYNTDLYHGPLIARMIRHYEKVLNAVAADPKIRLNDLPLMDRAELKCQYEDWQGIGRPEGVGSISDRFVSQSQTTPDAVAVRDENRFLTYTSLASAATGIALLLRARGLGPGQVAGIYLDRCPELVAAMLGVLEAGGAYLALDPEHPTERTAYMLADAEASYLLGPQQIPMAFKGVRLCLAPRPANADGNSRPRSMPGLAPAYIMYTSGSTGKPKGVVVSRNGLRNYAVWAAGEYMREDVRTFPLFTSVAFDLTLTSIFVPLIAGGTVAVYAEAAGGGSATLLRVFSENRVDIIKLTPSHLALTKGMDLKRSRLQTLILGGEDLGTSLAREVHQRFGGKVRIYNEYGPTEAVVGCMIHRFHAEADDLPSVPIGRPAAGSRIYLLDENLRPRPRGLKGELFIGGEGLTLGYQARPDLTAENLVPNPFAAGERLYRTGDRAVLLESDDTLYLGRGDTQVKIRGGRLEPGEVEAALTAHPRIRAGAVAVKALGEASRPADVATEHIRYCAQCGIPSNFPEILFNGRDICSMCVSFKRYQDQVANFFGTMTDLQRILNQAKKSKTGKYDCLMLLSGGKDSTYALFRIVEMGAKVLVFSLDNGFISEGAKANIRRAVKALDVDLVFGSTPAMNQIFVDSLQRFDNVCNGCFKTIYTMGMNLAHEKGIKTIVTGLSRGQLFETRLAQLYENGIFDVDQIEKSILDARKVYHRVPDAVTGALDQTIFQDDRVFEDIQYVDFYRYCDVSLDDLYGYLAAHAPWVRPADTGRSTNCLINEAGIYLHKKHRGYHNYAFPYCWDVRLGHKTREAALAELDDPISETRVADILATIGYQEPQNTPAESLLVAYYVADQSLTTTELRAWMKEKVPDFMVPTGYHRLESLPLALSGKVDRARLPDLDRNRPELETAFAAPLGPIEEKVAAVLGRTLRLDQVGRHDNFFELGGHSMLATQLIFQLRETFEVALELQSLFAAPTVAGLAELVVKAQRGRDDYEPLPVLAPDSARRQEAFPLTDVQQAYWIGRRDGFELGNVSAHGYSEIDFENLNIQRFETAFAALIARHGMLRAVITPEGNQRIFEDVPRYQPVILDLRQASAGIQNHCLDIIRTNMSHQVLPGDRWPIFEMRASMLTERRTRLHLSADALISDAWSFQILIGELIQLYRAPQQPLEPLAISFRDYVLAERQLRHTGHYRRAKGYWLARIPTLPPGPALPTVQNPAGMERPRFERFRGMLDATRWSNLQQQAVRGGLTPSGILLAAFAEVLAVWSKSPKFTINLTLFNRLPLHPHVNRIVGDFTSINLLEVDFRSSDHFANRARGLQERLWKDLDHRYYSGVQVQQELAKHRAKSPGMAMPVVFTSTLGMNPARRDEQADAMSNVRVHYSISQTPQVLLDHQVSEENGALYFNWDAVQGVYPPGLLDAMFQSYQDLLARLCEGALHELLPVRLPQDQMERRELLNQTRGPLPKEMLHELFTAQVSKGPDLPAVIHEKGILTYAGLHQIARALGRILRNRGALPNQLIAVLMEKGAEQVIAVLAIHFAGAAYLPIEAGLPQERIGYLLEQGGVALVLSQSWLEFNLNSAAITRLDIDRFSHSDPLREVDDLVQTQEDLAYVIFTSGSTGKPKGVTLSHRGPANTVMDLNRRFKVQPQDRVLAISSLSFDLSVYDIFGMLAAGGALVIPGPADLRDPARWADLMDGHGISLWNSVPALMKLLAEYAIDRKRRLTRALRLVMLSGDWIPVPLPDQIRGLADGVTVISMGGATEASIWSIIYPIGDVPPHWSSIPYGRPMVNQYFYVMGPRLEIRPDWAPGELYIGGEGIALRYWRDPEKTATSFLAHPQTGARIYRTGDLGRYLPDGHIEFLGRDDFQVKVQGYRIELGEIEVALGKHPRVRTAIATATGPRDNRRLAAYIVLASGSDPGSVEWRAFLRKTLPEYMIPSHFVILDKLPLTANGKVDRKALPAPDQTVAHAQRVQSSTPLEEVLCELWAQLLDLVSVAHDDNFFELGGNSLVAIRLIAKLQELFEVKVALPRFFENPTVGGLVGIMEEQRADNSTETDALPTIAPDGSARFQPFPLTDIQQAYWVGRQGAMALGNVATHTYREIDFSGMDLARLEHAFRQLIRRHDMLRMVVRADGTQQFLERVPAYRIVCGDLSDLDSKHVEEALAATRQRMSHQVFQTEKWPLFEVRAHRLTGDVLRIHIGVDLLIADARSFQMLQDEWFLRCTDPSLPENTLEISFRDYVLAERRSRKTSAYRRAQVYWTRRLSTMPPAPKLALAKPIHLLRSPEFSRCKSRLEQETWQHLKRRGSSAGLSPSGMLSAAFAEVLTLWSASPRFTINLTTFNRLPLHDRIEDLVGDFTSTTLLAVDCTQASFEDRARRIQEQIWHDLEHRMFSGIEVMRALRRQTRGAAGVMPVVFTSNLVHGPANGGTARAPWRAKTVFSISQTPQVLLDHQVTELADELLFNWDYLAEAFPRGYMSAMFAAYCDLLKKLAHQEKAWVDGL